MTEQHRTERREFLKTSAAVMVAGISSGISCQAQSGNIYTLEEAVQKVGRLPRRKLGRSGHEVSVLIGAGDMNETLSSAAIQCGVNYWHKANRWVNSRVPPAILKDREAHYCQVNVDRLGGNHETGRFDEEAHVAFVRDVLK